jgi:hypothetical protein
MDIALRHKRSFMKAGQIDILIAAFVALPELHHKLRRNRCAALCLGKHQ